jgi:hypothetical protein
MEGHFWITPLPAKTKAFKQKIHDLTLLRKRSRIILSEVVPVRKSGHGSFFPRTQEYFQKLFGPLRARRAFFVLRTRSKTTPVGRLLS